MGGRFSGDPVLEPYRSRVSGHEKNFEQILDRIAFVFLLYVFFFFFVECSSKSIPCPHIDLHMFNLVSNEFLRCIENEISNRFLVLPFNLLKYIVLRRSISLINAGFKYCQDGYILN